MKKLTVISKKAKNPIEVTIILDEANQTAFNQTTGKIMQAESIRKNYNIISTEEINETIETEVAEVETAEVVAESIETTQSEPTADETTIVASEIVQNNVNEETNNANETTDSTETAEDANVETDKETPFLAYPFYEVSKIEAVDHKKLSNVKYFTFEANGFFINLSFDADASEKSLKLIKRGFKVTKDGKLVESTTSMTKGLKTIGVDERDIKWAKESLLRIKQGK